MGPIICISNKFPGDVDATSLGTTKRGEVKAIISNESPPMDYLTRPLKPEASTREVWME